MPIAVILTALSLEYRAVKSHLDSPVEVVHPKGTIYECGSFDSGEETWEVIVAQVGMGNQRAALETERALSHFRPNVALFVGVAGGLKDVKLGDVVVASKVYAYEYGKAGVEFLPRPEVGLASYSLEQRAIQVARDNIWQQRILPPRAEHEPEAIVKPIAAGAQVVASNRAATYQFLRNSYSDAAAVEMEGHGFLEAARASEGVLALVVRGISDLVEGKTESDHEGWQLRAAHHAAAFAFEVLARFRLGGGYDGVEPVPQFNLNSARSTLGRKPSFKTRGVPPPRLRSFAGRKAELDWLREEFSKPHSTEPKIVVVHGLSGMGKTQLCREYLELHQAEYQLVYWLSAVDTSQATLNLAQLSSDLGLPGYDPKDAVRSSDLALRWLEQNGNWLLILDNADPSAVASLIPSSGDGHILITSNAPHWSSITPTMIRLDGLLVDDAAQFLLQRTRRNDRDGATRIAEAFDCLPLALEQAAAYIGTSDISFEHYEELLGLHRPELLEDKSPFTDYPESVYSAISLSVEKSAKRYPDAVNALVFVSFLKPSGIPRWLVREAISASLEERFNDFLFHKMLTELSSSSLISIEGDALSTHPLVQAFVLDRLPPEAMVGWLDFCMHVFAFTFPDSDDSAEWARCELLVDHVLNVFGLTQSGSWEEDFIDALYNNVGSCLHLRGREEESYEILSKHVQSRIQRYGDCSPEAALAMNNLLNVLVNMGRPEEARDLGDRAIEILTKDRETSREYALELGTVYSNRARTFLYGVNRKSFGKARRDFYKALAIHLEVVGKKHVSTAIDINNLGTVDREEGKWVWAYGHFAIAVEIHREVQNPPDFRLAIALYNLGTAEYYLKKYPEAAAHMWEAIEIFDSLPVGGINTDYVHALLYLGRAVHSMGMTKQALTYFDQAMELGTTILGSESRMLLRINSERLDVASEIMEPQLQKYV